MRSQQVPPPKPLPPRPEGLPPTLRRHRSTPAPDRSRRRKREDLQPGSRRQNTWTPLEVTDLVSVVRVAGVLDRSALRPCRETFDQILAERPALTHMVIDLEHVTDSREVTVALLSAARRYLRARGVFLVLAAVPWPLSTALRDAHLVALYEVQPSTAVALARLGVRVAPLAAARH